MAAAATAVATPITMTIPSQLRAVLVAATPPLPLKSCGTSARRLQPQRRAAGAIAPHGMGGRGCATPIWRVGFPAGRPQRFNGHRAVAAQHARLSLAGSRSVGGGGG